MKDEMDTATTTTVRCLTCGRTGNAGSYPMIDHDFAGFAGPHMDYEAESWVSHQEVEGS